MPETLLSRIGFMGVGVALLHLCSDIWSRVGPYSDHQALFLTAIWVLLLGGLGFIGTAFLATRPLRLQPLLLAMVLFAQWTIHSGFAVTESNSNAPSDTVTVSLSAAVLNSLGYNPYNYNMADVTSAYAATGMSMTPHLDGGQVEYLPYPPLHFLALRPVLPWGLEGARFLYSLCHSLLLIAVFLYAPARFRGIVLVPLLLDPELIHFPLYWASDSVWTLLLALMLWHWKRPLLRGVLLGLACAYKQTPWLFAPFLAVRILREEEKPLKALAVYFATSFGTFTLFNLPYAWSDFSAWFQGTFDPMLSPYLPLGRGLSMLTQTGVLPFGKNYYATVTLFMFATMIWCYYLNFRRLRPLLWWFPALVLFFSWRSMQHYFIYSIPMLMMELSRHDFEAPPEEKARRWYLPPAVAAIGVAIATIIYWPGPRTVDMRIATVRPNDVQVSIIELDLTNNGEKTLRPNFYGRTNWRTYPWVIIDGPLQLEPGTSGRYTIGTDLIYRTLSGHRGGQVLVSDGTGQNGYLAIEEFPSQDSLKYARGFDPPPSTFWSPIGEVWQEGDAVYFSAYDEKTPAGYLRSMTLPFSSISLELLRPEEFPWGTSFGLEVSDNRGQKISVMLGDGSIQGHYSSNHFYKVVDSKPGWNKYKLNLRALYMEAGFELPKLERIVRADVELLDRPIDFSIRLLTKSPVKRAGMRNLKLETQTAPGHRMADMLANPKAYHAILGDIAARRRHFDKAFEYYRNAWPLDSAMRRTQEKDFLVIPGPVEFRGKFPLAGYGWGEPELMDGAYVRPVTALLSTIRVLAKPGLKINLDLSPPTSYSIRWDEEPWQVLEPGQTFTVTGPAQIRELSIIPKAPAGLRAILVSE